MNKKYTHLGTLYSVPVDRRLNRGPCWRLWENWSNTETEARKEIRRTITHRVRKWIQGESVCFDQKEEEEEEEEEENISIT